MHKFLLRGSAAALLLNVSVAGYADQSVSLGPPISVTATRTALTADQEVAPVIVITPRQIQLSGARTITALLQQYAGLDIAGNGGAGQPASLFLRGTNSNQTLVMVDGVKINPANGSGAALANIHLNDIERIEIVKGPRAALYGSDAIGGVINIITKQAANGLHYGAHLGAGRYATYDSGAHVDFGRGKSSIGISASNFHTSGFPAVTGTPFDSGNRDHTLNAHARTKFGGVSLQLHHWQSTGDTQYTGFSSSPPYALTPFEEHFQNRTTDTRLSGNFSENWHSQLQLSHMVDEIDQLQSDPYNPGQTPDFMHTQRNAIDWQNNIALGDNQMLTAGIYSEAQHAGSRSYGLAYDAPDRINAVYAEDDLDLKQQRLVLAARNTHDQAFGNHVTWNIDYGYDFTRSTRVTVGAGTGFRAPSAEERFGFGGNPALQPETSRNLELGLRHRFSTHQRLRLALFSNRLDNLIEYVVTPATPNGENRNVAHARVRGLEAAYELSNPTWTWHSSVIFQRPENLDTGNRLLRRAERSLTSSLVWRLAATQLALHLIASGPRSDLDFNTGAPLTDAGYVLTGIAVHQQVGRRIILSGSIENLFDVQYQTAAGYNTAGRSIFLRLAYSI